MKTVRKAFTLIELLIVIAVLGILAVAVLSAINPVEQINRSRDTGKRSDAEQLLSAIDRFYASAGYYPWQSGSTDSSDFTVLTKVTAEEPVKVAGCTLLDMLSSGVEGLEGCVGTEELKNSFNSRITALDNQNLPKERPLYLYYDSTAPSASTYVCFVPQSGAFKREADDRCLDGNIPDDLDEDLVCNVAEMDGETDVSLTCLP